MIICEYCGIVIKDPYLIAKRKCGDCYYGITECDKCKYESEETCTGCRRNRR